MRAGDEVMSGTINESGVILIEATKTARDSSLQRMIALAESADAVIVRDNVDAIVYLFRIAKKTRKRITGVLNTVSGALFHNCGSGGVVISAFVLLFAR